MQPLKPAAFPGPPADPRQYCHVSEPYRSTHCYEAPYSRRTSAMQKGATRAVALAKADSLT